MAPMKRYAKKQAKANKRRRLNVQQRLRQQRAEAQRYIEAIHQVAYPAVADKCLGSLTIRLKGCHQPVIRTPNAFSIPHSPRLAGI